MQYVESSYVDMQRLVLPHTLMCSSSVSLNMYPSKSSFRQQWLNVECRGQCRHHGPSTSFAFRQLPGISSTRLSAVERAFAVANKLQHLSPTSVQDAQSFREAHTNCYELDREMSPDEG